MLTPAQLETLATDIAANQDTADMHANGDLQGLANLYNAAASPAFTVWRTAVPVEEVMRNGFDWTRVDNLSVGKARIWEWLTQFGTFNAAQSNIRAGVDACWVGTQADLNVRAAVYVHCKRAASRLEKLFATGTGSDAVPATMVVEGQIDYQSFINL